MHIKHDENDLLSAKSLNKFYGNFHALKDININLKRGEIVVICGPSGSGKSTLIRCLNYLEEPRTGEVVFNGELVRNVDKDLKNLRRRVSMVFQNFNLYPHLTVQENCALAPNWVKKIAKSEAATLAMHHLQRVKISEQADKYPNQLSGGQQQRVAIARALAMEPEIILFDEPTSALDPEMVKEVLDVMIELAESGQSMICVTHEMGFAKRAADRIIFMADGEIIEEGCPIEFFENPKTERAREFLSHLI